MTPADIKRIASEAGFGFDPTFGRCCPKPMWLAEPAELTRFAALVRAQALGDAARTCLILDALFVPTDDYSMPPGPHQCAATIRALGDTK